MTNKKKSPEAIRQAGLRQRRIEKGYARKEYWATPEEHASLAKHLAEIRDDEKPRRTNGNE